MFSAFRSQQRVNSVDAGSLFFRLLVIAEPESRFTLIEEYTSSTPELAAYTNIVSELFVEQGARLEYVSLQNLSRETWHFGNHHARVGGDADAGHSPHLKLGDLCLPRGVLDVVAGVPCQLEVRRAGFTDRCIAECLVEQIGQPVGVQHLTTGPRDRLEEREVLDLLVVIAAPAPLIGTSGEGDDG